MHLPRRITARLLVAMLLLSTFSPASAFADTSFSLNTLGDDLAYVVEQFALFISHLTDAFSPHLATATDLTASAAASESSPGASATRVLDFLATTTAASSTSPAAVAADQPAAQTSIIQRPVVERVVEKAVPQKADSVSPLTLATLLANLRSELLARITSNNTTSIAQEVAAGGNPGTYNFTPASARIDNLSNTTVNNPTISGGSISGATVAGYLPLAGGNLTGTLSGTDLSLSGTLTAGMLNVAGLSSSGALSAPYFSATSTTATSTFAGGLTVGTSQFIVQHATGNVGIGTTSPSQHLHVYDPVNSYVLIQGGNLGGLLFQDPATYANINTFRDGSLRLQASAVGWVAGSNQLILASSGNVGIGTTTPTSILHIAKDTGVLKLDTNSVASQFNLQFADAGAAKWDLYKPGDNNLYLYDRSISSNVVTFKAGGNVGIGTTTPSYKLDVGGFINTDGTSGGYKMAGNTVLYASTTNTSLAVGASAAAAWMSASSSAWQSVAIGQGALGTTPTTGAAEWNTAVGNSALNANTAGQGNTATGWSSLTVNTTGIRNTAIGMQALWSNTTGQYNTAVGNGALIFNTTGTNNTAHGDVALENNTTGNYNTAVGDSALFTATSSSNNTAVGISAGRLMSGATGAVGGNNSLFGYQAGYDITTGSNNLILGYYPTIGTGITTGSDNILIGDGVRSGLTVTSSNQLNIGNLIFGTSVGTGATLSTGNVGIGTSSPAKNMEITAAGTADSIIRLSAAGNSSYYTDIANSVNGARSFAISPLGVDAIAIAGVGGYSGITVGNVGTNLVVNPSASKFVFTGGNVGIGTTTPQTLLSLQGNPGASTNSSLLDLVSTTNVGPAIYLGGNGTYDGRSWRIIGGGSANLGGSIQNDFAIVDQGAAAARLVINSTGNVGIGTTSPTAQLSTTGTVRFSNFGAGTLTTDASGNLSVSSDERLKNIQGTFSRGLADIVKLTPILYQWKPETGYDASTTYAGFSAQNVQAAIPEAVGQDGHGYLTLQDRPLIAALVNAEKEIGTISGSFKIALTQWLGDAGNGLDKLFAKDIYATNGTFDTLTAHHVHSDELCAGSVCVNQQQLAALLAAIGQQAAAGTPFLTGMSIATTAPPIIHVNSDNPAHIRVGDTYADLGATIISPDTDKNLGILTFLNGVQQPQIIIDTSAEATDTIDYVVTDQFGQAATATRTVIVSPVINSI